MNDLVTLADDRTTKSDKIQASVSLAMWLLTKGKRCKTAKSGSLLPVKYDPKFAAEQLLGGNTVTPGGRTIMDHAARRMVNPPAGRAGMTMQEIDQVLDTGTKIQKVTPHPMGTTVTVQHPGMPGKP